jgi:hypothetical protein
MTGAGFKTSKVNAEAIAKRNIDAIAKRTQNSATFLTQIGLGSSGKGIVFSVSPMTSGITFILASTYI